MGSQMHMAAGGSSPLSRCIAVGHVLFERSAMILKLGSLISVEHNDMPSNYTRRSSQLSVIQRGDSVGIKDFVRPPGLSIVEREHIRPLLPEDFNPFTLGSDSLSLGLNTALTSKGNSDLISPTFVSFTQVCVRRLWPRAT
ncbi:hypothetical protein SNOG_11690 [Parastagonospora nodorum SN15]|uniref:Uncharacterized protein n=1 Tax=Phaeosphaeria nodorum (strain SN15 / ATCC MYA-4574 / FGSC 10173) TaxID=321614 RepID=Q0U974_PHANO|nr:hypothetical protein SNOG_11690 [Parastagonospora nodorum SN15]EAT80734.1 hypothetical protein SNOG_11690 [Parastagonospora nodorum SN15]